MKTVRYYSDELNDDFASNHIETRELPENFRYVSACPFFRFLTFVVYRILVTPMVFVYIKVKFHHRVRNRKVLRKAGRQGYYLFGNHTNGDLDAFVPTLVTFPKKAYIIVNPDATSIRGIRTLVMMLGALPLPGGVKLFRKFIGAMEKRVNDGNVIMVYPEAHIWPYYTDIRDFNPASLGYAYMNGKPVYCLTNVYVKRRFGKRPKVVTYIDGPFEIDREKTRRENIDLLKEKVYGTMKKRVAEHPKYEYKYTYVKKETGRGEETGEK